MAKKVCAYKNCDSYQDSEHISPYTFFAFPSDAVRSKVWRDLSHCLENAPKFLCSKHFDRTKYIADNPRRKTLLHTAVPFAYASDDNNTTPSKNPSGAADVSYDFYDTHKKVVLQELEKKSRIGAENEETLDYEILNTSEMLVEEEDQVFDDEENENYNIPFDHEAEIDNEIRIRRNPSIDTTPGKGKNERSPSLSTASASNQRNKRKELFTNSVPVKHRKTDDHSRSTAQPSQNVANQRMRDLPKLGSSYTKPNKKMCNIVTPNSVEIIINDDDLEYEEITDPKVSTFIFKGEEYVQLPKCYYLKQKTDLMKQILYYKNLVQNVKSLLGDDHDFDA